MHAYDTRFCKRCQRHREFRKRAVPHQRHLTLTIVTLGLWVVGWAAMAVIGKIRPWRCGSCHSTYEADGERSPHLGLSPFQRAAFSLAHRPANSPSIWR